VSTCSKVLKHANAVERLELPWCYITSVPGKKFILQIVCKETGNLITLSLHNSVSAKQISCLWFTTLICNKNAILDAIILHGISSILQNSDEQKLFAELLDPASRSLPFHYPMYDQIVRFLLKK